MAALSGECPNCGAPIELQVGSSLAKICEYCRVTVVRGDLGLEHLGQVALLAPTSSLIAIGDEGTLAGRHFRVMGLVQLDHGAGPWDEYLVTLDHGARWGWLAYAEGRWLFTEQASLDVQATFDELRLEQVVRVGAEAYSVAEKRVGRVVSAAGELPFVVRPGSERRYADLHGAGTRFATLDYGALGDPLEIHVGRSCDDPELVVTELGPRRAPRVDTLVMRCPKCGSDLPRLTGERADRIGCAYCGAVSEVATQNILFDQERARTNLAIPIGSRGMLQGTEWICTAVIERSTQYDGERYSWEEFLLWNRKSGFRWLVKDPETGWLWVEHVSVSSVQRSASGDVRHGGHVYRLRNRGQARVDYVLGEIYWKCRVGELARTEDYESGQLVLCREEGPGEVRWSACKPISWPTLAIAFGLDVDGPGGHFLGDGSERRRGCLTWALIIIVVFIAVFVLGSFLASLSERSCPPGDPDCRSTTTTGGYRGGGIYFGGK
jgi:hypothetical protein